jgi:lysophospholipase L1-like esterase
MHSDKPPSASQRSPERERVLRNVVVAFCMLTLFCACEVGLRVYARVSNYIPKVNLYDAPHYFLGRALIPNAHFKSTAGEINVNSHGFRGEEFATSKPKGNYRIFAMGGSTTFGYYPATSSDQTAYPGVLATMLQANRPNPSVDKYEVINAGVPGYSMRTLTQSLLARILFFEPDMVVITEVTNDLARYGNLAGLDHPLENQFVPMGIVTGFLDNFLGWSYAVQELRFVLETRVWGGLIARFTNVSDPNSSGSKNWVRDARYEDVFRRDVRNLVRLAKLNGVTPVLATQAISFREDTDFSNLTADEITMQFDKPAIFYATVPGNERYQMFRRYNGIIREVAEAEGAIYADVDAAVPKTSEYHWDYCHLTDKGSAIQAEVIFQAISKRARSGS